MAFVIPYCPRKLQKIFHDNRTRFTVMVCHRRFGKTVAALIDLILGSLQATRPMHRAAYIAPFKAQAKDVVWEYLKLFTRAVPGVKYNESELTCLFPNGARITLYGADNPTVLRGNYLDDVVIDEPAQIVPTVWSSIIRPMLADRQGRALFIGTPSGENNLLDILYKIAEKGKKDWSNFMFKASETNHLKQEELDDMKEILSDGEYQQELECSFDVPVRYAYYEKAILALNNTKQINDDVRHTPELLVHTGWDLGMADTMSIWFFQVDHTGTMRFIDFYANSDEGLSHYIGILNSKAQSDGYLYGTHIAPPDMHVRELGTGLSRYDVARSLGVKFDVLQQTSVSDGIDLVRRRLPLCWINKSKCAEGVKAIKAYTKTFDAKRGIASSTPLHNWASHPSDALRYAMIGYRDLLQKQNKHQQARTEYDVISHF